MAMPMTRFLAYVKQIPAVRAEETLAAIEATAFPHLEKRARRQALKRLQRTAASIPAPAKKGTRMIGGIPADVAGLIALGREAPILRGLVQIVKKKPEDESQ